MQQGDVWSAASHAARHCCLHIAQPVKLVACAYADNFESSMSTGSSPLVQMGWSKSLSRGSCGSSLAAAKASTGYTACCWTGPSPAAAAGSCLLQ